MRHPLAVVSAAIVAVGSIHCGGSSPGGGGYPAPSGAAAVARSGDSVGITWIDRSAGESGFRIERSTPAAAAFVEVGTAPADAASFEDAGLAPGTSYSYRVKAFGPGGQSEYSNVASASTPATPAAPAVAPVLTTGLVSAAVTSVLWTTSSGAEGYRLERQREYWDGQATVYTPWALIRTLDAQASSHADYAVSPSTTYRYRIVAYNLGGETSWSNTVSTSTSGPSKPPGTTTAITVQKQSPTSALFTWQVPTGTQIEYLVITITGSNGGSTGLTMLGDATSLTLIDLAPGVTYTFSMQAWNIYGGGAGSYAAPVTAQVVGPPVGPATSQLLHAYPVADNRRVLSDLLVSKNNMVFSTGELIVGCNWFMNTFLWVQNSICYSSAIRFDVSALAGKTVTQAQLWLKPSYPAASPDTNYSVSAIATSWSASALTGLTDLQLYAAGESMVAAPTSFSPIGFNVTQIVQNWASGAWSNSGFLLQDMSYVFPYATIFRASSFYSSDYYYSAVDDPPQLWVEYH